MKNDSLGDRMKDNYETRSRTYLTRRTPVILRLDGKAFHTFTRGCNKPFDDHLHDAMTYAARALLNNIQGAKVAYTQSDEISILITDYENFETEAWYNYNIQKMCSVAAAIASVAFTMRFAALRFGECPSLNDVVPAHFDCRAFNLPKEEVNNYFLWRQQDWWRNSVQMAAQSVFSHKELQGVNCNSLKEMLFSEKGIDWDKYPDCWRNGTTLYNNRTMSEHNFKIHHVWMSHIVEGIISNVK
jgi:tRNA(His) 5'-end guanylyltransferase